MNVSIHTHDNKLKLVPSIVWDTSQREGKKKVS